MGKQHNSLLPYRPVIMLGVSFFCAYTSPRSGGCFYIERKRPLGGKNNHYVKKIMGNVLILKTFL